MGKLRIRAYYHNSSRLTVFEYNGSVIGSAVGGATGMSHKTEQLRQFIHHNKLKKCVN